jgi:hypothetical protein
MGQRRCLDGNVRSFRGEEEVRSIAAKARQPTYTIDAAINSIVLMEGDTNRKETDYQPDGRLVKISISKSTFSLTRSETL